MDEPSFTIDEMRVMVSDALINSFLNQNNGVFDPGGLTQITDTLATITQRVTAIQTSLDALSAAVHTRP